MKKIFSIFIFLLATSAASAQLFRAYNDTISQNEKYRIGTVPVVNGKVVFEEAIPAKGSDNEIMQKAQAWIDKRFRNSEIIKFKQYDSDKSNTLTVKSEEYITFRKKALELDRTRITYFLDITSQNGECKMKMYRITYLYNEEYKGGEQFTAESYITDDEAFNRKKTKVLKKAGKFRARTIDLKNELKSGLQEALN